MEIKINNITFNFFEQGSGMLPDDENIGIGHLLLPGNMSRRFKNECGIDGLIPYYDYDDMRSITMGSDHECYNSDTQIVLMNWLFEKKRQYKLDYHGLDPFWLFHDACHAENDVYGSQIDGIYSHVEHSRLLQGADFAKDNGIYIKAETIYKLNEAWVHRWTSESKSTVKAFVMEDFRPFIDEDDLELFEYRCELY